MADFELVAPAGFEWDDVKSEANLVKHGIAFDDASEVFLRAGHRQKIKPQRRGEMARDWKIQ